MLILLCLFQCWIIGRSRQIDCILAAVFQLVTDRLKNIPVSFAVSKDSDTYALIVSFISLPA